MHRQSNGEDYYYGHDHLYSTVVLLDDGGNVVERYEYDAYGTVLAYTDDGNDDTWFTGDDTTASASAKSNPYTFTGRRLDMLDGGNLLRMHYRHRDYDAFMGRFLQHDPLGVVPGINGAEKNLFSVQRQYADGSSLYFYARGNPVHNNDAWGLRIKKYKCCSSAQQVLIDHADICTARRLPEIEEGFTQFDLEWIRTNYVTPKGG